MEDRKKLIRQFIFILLVGIAVSFFSGDYQWSYTFQPDWNQNLEIVLTNLNLILPFIALAVGLGVYIYLRIWNSPGGGSGKEGDQDESGEQLEDGNPWS